MVLNGKVEAGIIECRAKAGTKGLYISTLLANFFVFSQVISYACCV